MSDKGHSDDNGICRRLSIGVEHFARYRRALYHTSRHLLIHMVGGHEITLINYQLIVAGKWRGGAQSPRSCSTDIPVCAKKKAGFQWNPASSSALYFLPTDLLTYYPTDLLTYCPTDLLPH